MSALAAGFPDVSQNHPYYDAVEYLRTHDMVHGYPDGTFHADATINRAEFVKIITRAMTSPSDTPSQCGRSNELYLPFSDVHQADWFAFRVCLAAALSIVSGYPDGTFRPAASINFVEAAKIIVNAADIASDAGHTVPSEPWYKDFVVDLEVRNAIPIAITRFDQPITRGEMAEMMYRLLEKRTDRPSQSYESLTQANAQQNSELDVVYAGETGRQSSYGYWDASIIRRYPDGRQEVVVESVKAALPAVRDPENLTISRYAMISSSLLIVQTSLRETDNSAGDLYKFDASTRSFSKMKLNEIYDGFYGGEAMSPDSSMIAWAPNDESKGAQKLYLLDLRNDSYRTLVTLPANETIVTGFALASQTEVSWTDSTHIRYSVYQTGTYDLKGYRTVSIQ
ncbi:MAG: S-layer homology domain-containing protein [Candidatus Peregrinibacteria bacterium]|nr:S-layer homology domain-containing protein [Candidatus Peregrinibacteria bacterium]